MSSFSVLLLLLLLFCGLHSITASTKSNTVDRIWNPTGIETGDKWVEYPPEWEPRVEAEKAALILDDNKRKVDMTVYQVFPEELAVMRDDADDDDTTDYYPSQRVWPLLRGMVRRLRGILAPRVVYYIQSGEDYGCRVLDDNDEPHARDSLHCKHHCTHGGRYCADHPPGHPEKPLRLGRDVVLEVWRRLCLENTTVPSHDARFTKYLKEFERLDCFGNIRLPLIGAGDGDDDYDERDDGSDVEQCSFAAMASIGVTINDLNTTRFNRLRQCLHIKEGDTTATIGVDKAHDLLEHNLRAIQRQSWNAYKLEDMPQIEVDSLPIMPEDYGLEIRQWSSKLIFQHYCDAFPYCSADARADQSNSDHEDDDYNMYNQGIHGKPLACQVCGDCRDVQTCLWTLQCDGKSVFQTKDNSTEIVHVSQEFHTCGADQMNHGDNSSENQERDDDSIGSDNTSQSTDTSTTTTTTSSSSSTNPTTTKKKQSFLSTMIMLVIVGAVSLYVVALWRRRQAILRKAQNTKSVIAQAEQDFQYQYSDKDNLPMDDDSLVFASYTKWGKSVRPSKDGVNHKTSSTTNKTKNLAPRPSEDPDSGSLHGKGLEDVSLDDISATPRDIGTWV